MADGPITVLAFLHEWWGILAWSVLAVFLAGTLLEYYDREHARTVLVGAWVVLAVFWIASIHYFVFEQKSITEGLGVIVGVPLSLYVGYLLASGRDRLLVVSRAVAVMWAIYLPLSSLWFLRDPMIAVVADQSAWALGLLTTDFSLVQGTAFPDDVVLSDPPQSYHVSFLFQREEYNVVYTIQTACTGLGSMAIFGGLVAAVEAPLRRKLTALGAAVGIIYVLNIVRNVFIAYTFGTQKLQLLPEVVVSVFGLPSTYKVSYIVADRIVAQFLSVVALVGITYVVVMQLPEVLTIVEEGLYVLTRREYDLQESLGVGARTDGGTEGQ